jgi:hypothetical protein
MTRRWTARWDVRLLVLALGCLIGGLGWAGSVRAAGDDAVQVAVGGAAFTDHPAGGLLDVSGLAPGGSVSVTFGVRTSATVPESLALTSVSTRNDENGCGAAEAAVDHTCTGRTGELGLELAFTIVAGLGPSGPYRQVWQGSAAMLGGGVGTGVSVAAGADRWIRLTATVPASAGDEIEGDAFLFALRVQLTGSAPGGGGVTIGAGHQPASGGVAGTGAHAGRGHAGGVVLGGVSLTGRPLALFLAGAALLGGAGALLALAGTRRRRGPRADPG